MSGFFTRTLTGIFIVGVVAGAILLGPYTFFLITTLICLSGVWEFYRLLKVTRPHIRPIAGLSLSACLLSTVFLIKVLRQDWEILLINVPVMSFIFCTVLFVKSDNPFISLALTFLGVVYIALPFALLLLTAFMRNDGYNGNFLLGYFCLLWSNDTGAYAAGTLMGRTPLAPVISPKKTWEGSAGGMVMTGATAYVLSVFWDDLTLTEWLVLALIVIVMGTLGDLVKSVLKRSLQVKDSGKILPGHGGILDRFDSLIGSVPFVYSYMAITTAP